MQTMYLNRGFTLLEIAVVLAITAILIGGGIAGVSKFGSRAKIGAEAEKIVDQVWALRARATNGQLNPCLDFPAVDSVRTYLERGAVSTGFGVGDSLLSAYKMDGGVSALSIAGGTGVYHAVCFESRGTVGSATAALKMMVGLDLATQQYKTIRLLPSTGNAKVL